MLEMIIMIAWMIGIVLGIMWLFLPWIIISKIDEVIEELRKFNINNIKSPGGAS